MKHPPSVFQQAIFSAVGDPNRGSLLVNAVAGSGKSTTLLEALTHVPKHCLTLILAFNKAIAQNLATKIPSNVQAVTFHSHGLRALGRHLGKTPRIKADKVRGILKEQQARDPLTFLLYANYVTKLVSYAKNAGLGTAIAPVNRATLSDLVEHFDLTIPTDPAFDLGYAVTLAEAALTASNADTSVVDFDDMLYLALRLKVHFDKCHFIFIDEAQDTNLVQQHLIDLMLAPNGRVIAVGDPHQAIYGFRGADAQAMSTLQQRYAAVELPLSVCYRCSTEVVAHAQRYCPSIQPAESAPTGVVVKTPQPYARKSFTSADAILCRNVAPLIAFAFSCIYRDIPVTVLGREIGASLCALAKTVLGKAEFNTFEECLNRYYSRESQRLLKANNETALAALEDKLDCLRIFYGKLHANATLDDLTEKIESLFSDGARNRLTLSTIHKSKGLEWPKVFLLDVEKTLPSRHAKQEWQLQQERNLHYVGITRAALELHYINSGDWKD